MYVEPEGRSANDRAAILTPSYSPEAGKPDTCWVFYYHMYGANMGKLSVGVSVCLSSFPAFSIFRMFVHPMNSLTSTLFTTRDMAEGNREDRESSTISILLT